MKYPLSLFLILLIAVSHAQNRPFPQAMSFLGCIKPDTVSQSLMDQQVASYYVYWRNKYLKPSAVYDSAYYVSGGNTGGASDSKGTSEGHGYGMIVTALMAGYDANAKLYYDGLYKFFDLHRSTINRELMGWEIVASEASNNKNSASDGDLDIAYSLLLAHNQWGSDGQINYLQEAVDMITLGIKVSDVNKSYRTTLGDWDKSWYNSRPSDWMMSHFNSFHEYTGDSIWLNVVDELYRAIYTLQGTYAPNTGLLPDFMVNENPRPAAPDFLEGAHDGHYYYNAGRCPLRIVMGYGHYNQVRSKQAIQRLMSWATETTGNDPTRFKAGYTLDGTPIGNRYDALFVAPIVAAGTCDPAYQSWLNKGWMSIVQAKAGYFADSYNLLCLLYISGNWWVPTSLNGQSPFGQIASIPGVIEMEHFDLGGEGAAYHDTSSMNEFGFYRNEESVEIDTTIGGYQVQLTANEWLEFTVDVSERAIYGISFFVDEVFTAGALQLSFGYADITGELPVDSSGVVLYEAKLDQGLHIMRLTAVSGTFSIDQIRFDRVCALQQLTFGPMADRGPDDPPFAVSATSSSGLPVHIGVWEGPATVWGDTVTLAGEKGFVELFAMQPGDTLYCPADTVFRGFHVVVQEPYHGVPLVIPGVIESEDYDLGGEGLAYHDADEGQQGGAYRDSEWVDIESDGQGGYSVGWIQAGEWLEYTVNVETAGDYFVVSSVASEKSTGRFYFTMNGVRVSKTMTVASTGGWAAWEDVVDTVTLQAGVQVLRTEITGSEMNLNKHTFIHMVDNIRDLHEKQQLVVFPNPTSGYIHVLGGTLEFQLIRLLDMTGRVVMECPKSINSRAIDITPLKDGVYTMQILDDCLVRSVRVVKK